MVQGTCPVRRKKSRRANLSLALDDYLILVSPLALDGPAFLSAVRSDSSRHVVWNMLSCTKSLVFPSKLQSRAWTTSIFRNRR